MRQYQSSGSRLLKAYYMLATAEQAAGRLRQNGLQVRVVPQRQAIKGEKYPELTFALWVDYGDVREMAQAQSLVN